jgi:hypothetical protein
MERSHESLKDSWREVSMPPTQGNFKLHTDAAICSDAQKTGMMRNSWAQGNS